MSTDDMAKKVVSKIDISEIIGARIPLRKLRSTYSGACPFHDDSGKSFCVIPDRRKYHCFECGAKGTVIDFVMVFEKKSYAEAVCLLCRMLPDAEMLPADSPE